MTVPCARVRLPRGKIERCKSFSSRPCPSECTSPFLILVYGLVYGGSVMKASWKRHEHRPGRWFCDVGQCKSHEGRVLCPFAFTEQTRCASRGKHDAGDRLTNTNGCRDCGSVPVVLDQPTR